MTDDLKNPEEKKQSYEEKKISVVDVKSTKASFKGAKIVFIIPFFFPCSGKSYS